MTSSAQAPVKSHFLSGRSQSRDPEDYTLKNVPSLGHVSKSSAPHKGTPLNTNTRRPKNQWQAPRDQQTPSNQLRRHKGSRRLFLPGNQRYSASHGSRQSGLERRQSSPLGSAGPNPLPEMSHGKLVRKVQGIYRRLATVEEECIKWDKQQSESREVLSPAKWQALIDIHSTLLHEHHEFFLSSQHPVAQRELTKLAKNYLMPARMWRYGIHPLLELLRDKLPGSVEYMLHFIYIAYSMVTLFLESIPSFRETWIECLGDLARYRMAIEETDLTDRRVWATVSQYWYNQEADLSPDVGRVQHHLAVLSRPDALAQFFYYTKALLCRRPFYNSRESIALLFSSVRDQQYEQQDSMPAALIATHDVLFHSQTTRTDQFNSLANKYLSLLQREIPFFDEQGQGGAFVMSCNFGAIFQYGTPEPDIALKFPPRSSQATIAETSQATAIEQYEFALHSFAPPAPSSDVNSPESIDCPAKITSKLFSSVAFHGSALTFHSLAIFLDRSQLGDERAERAHAGIHTGLSFIWSIAIHPLAMQKLEPMIPWLKITRFLNSLLSLETDFAKIEAAVHPRFSRENESIRARNRTRKMQDETLQPEIPDHLPEDFLIRGQVWSELYYPEGFFEGGPVEHDRSFVEPQLLELVRRHRCLWLGVRLSMVCGIVLFLYGFLQSDDRGQR